MKLSKESYERAQRVIRDIEQDSRAVVTVILQPSGDLFVSNEGDVKELSSLYDRFNYYLEDILPDLLPGFKKGKNQ